MNKPLNSTIINICIIPSDSVGKSYVDISQTLNSPDTMFVLGGDKFAHMTVFMARFADSDIDKVIGAVELSLNGISRFNCRHTGYLITEGRYLESSYQKSSNLMSLHESLIENIFHLRINPGNPYEEGYFAPYNSRQQQNAIETGYDLAHDLYRPHVTLTRYKDNNTPVCFPAFPEVNLSFDVCKVCVYKADDNGAVYELIKAFEI